MNDEDALLAAICAQPDEDMPRLAFADYLQELGGNVNTAWAFFIRAQIQMVREMCKGPAHWHELAPVAARVKLLNVPFWHSQWIGRFSPADQLPIPELRWGNWERGFPVSVIGKPEELRSAWSRIASRVPFTILGMHTTADEDVEDLAMRPELIRVRELSIDTLFNQPPLTDRTLLALASSPYLSGLKRLRIASVLISDVGAEAVLASPHLANLGELRTQSWLRHRNGTGLSPDVRARLEARFGSNAAS